ncbi:hypothetical protein CY0110_16102 [Crocosphaera chwakensis CCY0110]|uniref:Uncharacterized protein n=1 Tax=Crocosphaera chwakensis CCY0110 TaxID=391612 RepID=A3IHQ2_9CHRO|nr:hypothetical protein CY0110_16102 [Crocosphaera chwakensis CCY0110]
MGNNCFSFSYFLFSLLNKII